MSGVKGWRRSVLLGAAGLWSVVGCATAPLMPYTTDTPPLVLVSADKAGIADHRGRFREVLCAVLQAGKDVLPDYRECDEVLVKVGAEPPGTGAPVNLGSEGPRPTAMLVLGLGWDCVAERFETGNIAAHLRRTGFDATVIRVDAFSSSAGNARQIRDAVLKLPSGARVPRVVLIGYSKGIVDILDAVVSFPEIHERVTAVVSLAGAVGGSPLANSADPKLLDLLRDAMESPCLDGDGGAIESLRTGPRQVWLASHRLPKALRYYSVVAFPEPQRISAALQPTYAKLSRIDGRNDGKLLYYDQVIPGSQLIAYVNADHWAIALPIGRSHQTLAELFVTENAFPREALVEAVMRYVTEDLSSVRVTAP